MANLVARAIKALFGAPELRSTDFRAGIRPTQISKPTIGGHTSEADYAAAMLPDPVNPRSQRGSVTRLLTSNSLPFAWEVVCAKCGQPNSVSNGDEDRQVRCDGCKLEFSIRGLALESVRSARSYANQTRGTHFNLTDPLSPKDWDDWRFLLPSRIPSQETNQRLKAIQEQLGDSKAGEVEWVGDAQPLGERMGGEITVDKVKYVYGQQYIPERSTPEWLENRRRVSARAAIIQAAERKKLLASETTEGRELREALEAANE